MGRLAKSASLLASASTTTTTRAKIPFRCAAACVHLAQTASLLVTHSIRFQSSVATTAFTHTRLMCDAARTRVRTAPTALSAKRARRAATARQNSAAATAHVPSDAVSKLLLPRPTAHRAATTTSAASSAASARRVTTTCASSTLLRRPPDVPNVASVATRHAAASSHSSATSPLQ